VMAAGSRSLPRSGPVGRIPRRLCRLTQVCVSVNGVVRDCQMKRVICTISAQSGGVSVNLLYGFEEIMMQSDRTGSGITDGTRSRRVSSNSLQLKPFKSVDTIRGQYIQGLYAWVGFWIHSLWAVSDFLD
jgi:hypothetical protein